MNKRLLNQMEKAIKRLGEDYYTRQEFPKMKYPIILKFHGAEMILNQATTQTIFDSLQQENTNLQSQIYHLKRKRGFKERIRILFTGRLGE